jgi:hypothetical protein
VAKTGTPSVEDVGANAAHRTVRLPLRIVEINFHSSSHFPSPPSESRATTRRFFSQTSTRESGLPRHAARYRPSIENDTCHAGEEEHPPPPPPPPAGGAGGELERRVATSSSVAGGDGDDDDDDGDDVGVGMGVVGVVGMVFWGRGSRREQQLVG